MSTLALTRVRQQALAIRRPHPLLNVMTWELRRFRASRLFWLQVLGLFCLLVLLTWAQATNDQFSIQTASAFIPGTSAWGLLLILPVTLLLLVVLLPFITADGVTRDLQRRTHELLMTTALPSWAYVWGRYLVGLLMSLGLATLLLAAILGMGAVLHLTIVDYPAPVIGNTLLLWVGMVVPATVLVSSVGFAVVTLFPRLSAMVKVVILMGWVVGTEVLPVLLYLPSGRLPTWYVAWVPPSALTMLATVQQYQPNIDRQSAVALTTAQFQQLVNTVANKAPDISAWFAPHLVEALLSLLLVALAALAFRRFRNVSAA
ncbi:MAG TPA: ABC transporter permease [Ktedonobacterales bacterium]|nr:ABC transporter permease [Ktedonobacterales bacterium]